MSWTLILFLNVIAISGSTLFQRLAMKREESNPILSSIIFQLTLGIIVLFFAITQGFIWPPMAQSWPLFLLSTILYACGSVLSFKALKLIEASEATILAGFSTVVTMMGAYVFLGERLIISQYLGALLVLLSIVIVQYRQQRIVFSQGTWFALAANSLFALAMVSDTFVVRSYDALSFAAVMSVLPGFLLCLFYFKQLPALVQTVKKIDKNLLLYTLLYSVAVVTFYAALGQRVLLSQVTVITKSNIILTVLLAAVFIKEKDNLWRKILAAVICMIGVVLVV